MKQFELFGKEREKSTKGELNKLRSQGFVPGVIYGGEENINVYFFINDLKKMLYTDDIYLIKCNINNQKITAVVKEVQYHPLSDDPVHIDLMEVDEDKVIKISYPIHFIGTPEGTKQGGKFMKKKSKLLIKGKVSSIPDILEVNVSSLNIGQTLKVKDITLPNIEILENPNTPLASVSRTRATTQQAAQG